MAKDFLGMVDWPVASQQKHTHNKLRKQNHVAITLFTLLLLAFLATACDPGSPPTPTNPCTPTNVSPSASSGIGVSKATDGEYIGISNGLFAFDTTPDQTRLDGDVKCQAASKFRAGKMQDAQKLWLAAHKEDSSDAEALIYYEDQQVVASHLPHITFVVATTLTGPFASSGRDNLQGAYIAQKEANDSSKLASGQKVVLLIANFGSNPGNDGQIARQIVQAANADKNIVGVMGFPLSAYVPQALAILQQAHLPIVSSGASSDTLSGISPYFFRVVPPDSVQARVGIDYAVHTLHSHTVALFYDPTDTSSNGLAQDLTRDFDTFKGVNVVAEKYTLGHPETLNALLTDAIKRHADLLYFTGYVTDLNVLLINLPSSRKMDIMGSDNFYQVQNYSIWSRSGFIRLHFTAFAYPDEWNIICQHKSGKACPAPTFFASYSQAFNDHKHLAPTYGYTRANSDTLVSFDALNVLLIGYQLALAQGPKMILTPSQEQAGLTMITGPHAFQGISGQISFEKYGNPINKATVLLYVDSNGFINVIPGNGIQGCFFVGYCTH